MPQPSPTTFDLNKPTQAVPAHNGRVFVDQQPAGNQAYVQLRHILNSRAFAGARRSQLFLRYIVDHALANPYEPLKEYSIALDVFERDASYDPAVNATVRVEAGRLRSRLRDYYTGEGAADPITIEIPKGSYRAVIRPRQPVVAPVVRQLALVRATPTSSSRRGLRHMWAIPAAFILGIFLGYRASH